MFHFLLVFTVLVMVIISSLRPRTFSIHLVVVFNGYFRLSIVIGNESCDFSLTKLFVFLSLIETSLASTCRAALSRVAAYRPATPLRTNLHKRRPAIGVISLVPSGVTLSPTSAVYGFLADPSTPPRLGMPS